MAQDRVRSCAVALYGVTEQLKADRQMEWVARMNNICQRVTEVISKEIIYSI